MKIRINGINNDKYLIALQKLAQAFDRDFKICQDDEFDYAISFSISVNNNLISVNLQSQEYCMDNQVVIIHDIEYDTKYGILVCFYRFLEKLTNKHLSYGVLTGIRPTKLAHYYLQKYHEKDVEKILQDKYLVSKEKGQLLVEIARRQNNLLDFNRLEKVVSIYINVPFCSSRCSYCSFTSYPYDYHIVTRKDYLHTLTKEIEQIGSFLKNNHIPITSIYIGGGTPSALDTEELTLLFESVSHHLYSKEVLEYTFEAGRPDTLSEDKLAIIKKALVNRISINPQTFNDKTLVKINRKHTIQDIYRIYNLARKMGFNNINMDLIIGLPDETICDYQKSIDEVVKLAPEEITIHYLAQKKGTPLFNERMQNLCEDYFKAFDYAYNTMRQNDYYPYYLYRQKFISGNLENIGYARENYESIYNILMIEEKQTIIGLGCGATSKFLNYDLIMNPKDLKTYINKYDVYLKEKINNLKNLLLKEER